jgi:hypothetical protein
MNPLEKTLKLYHKIPWFFQKITPNIQPNEYILQLNQKTNTSFLRYLSPTTFSLEIAKKYKEQFLFAFPMETTTGMAFTSFFAIDHDMLMQISPGMDKNDDIICGVAFHTNNPEKYMKMLDENKKFIITDTPTAGFAK